MSTKVLIVDDNEMYRNAFRRNLMLRDYETLEAEDGDQALEVIQSDTPDVIVTDLSMRTPDEGLDLIRSVKQIEPLLPVVMISAVGTFEEGAEASRLGAHSVISKSRLDEEIESLYRTIDAAQESAVHNKQIRKEVEKLGAAEDDGEQGRITRLREIAADTSVHPSVRAEAYDTLLRTSEADLRRQLESAGEQADADSVREAESTLRAEIEGFSQFEPDTRKELVTAEYFFQRQGGDQPVGETDFSRNIGFSYCFAVESEAKWRLRKRLQKFLSNRGSINLINRLIDKRTGQLDLFYHQHLARLQQVRPFDFTIDNVRQVFQRILEHQSRYKPDGLKALGIMVLCFGRDYTIKTNKETLNFQNPLNLKGFDSDEEVIHFAHLLVSLQHYRNPYIHPEISEMEKISKIRATAIECLNHVAKLS